MIELLVVMAILSILVGAAIPVLSPASDERRIREASRGVNAFLTGAQTRAVETGRPFGVKLRKLSQDTGRDDDNAVCLELSYVEQPSPFAGFEESSRVLVAQDPSGGTPVPGQFSIRFVIPGNDTTDDLPVGLDFEPLPPLFRLGDIIEAGGVLFKFNDEVSRRDDEGFYNDNDSTIGASVLAGNEQVIRSATNDGLGQLIKPAYDNEGLRLSDAGVTADLPYWSEPLPYKIHRQPAPTLNEPYQLPEGAAIDLRASGLGDPTSGGVTFYNDDLYDMAPTAGATNNRDAVYVMFSPEGTIERVQHNTGLAGAGATATLTTDTLYLLIGLRENSPAPSTPAEANFDDMPGLAGNGTDAEIQARKAKFNWLNPDARWVVVSPRTGSVITAEGAFVDPVAIAKGTGFTVSSYPNVLTERRPREIKAARALAGERAQLGGR